jgi:hypothetical protein
VFLDPQTPYDFYAPASFNLLDQLTLDRFDQLTLDQLNDLHSIELIVANHNQASVYGERNVMFE